MKMAALQEDLERKGFAILPGVLGPERVADFVSSLESALTHGSRSLLRSRGHVYGIRNLIDVWPTAAALAQMGTHEDLIAKGGPYAELYGIQAAACR